MLGLTLSFDYILVPLGLLLKSIPGIFYFLIDFAYYISSIGSLECNFGNQIISFQNILTFFSPSRKQEIALQRSHNWNNTYQYLVHHQHKTEIKDPLIFVLKAKYVKLN